MAVIVTWVMNDDNLSIYKRFDLTLEVKEENRLSRHIYQEQEEILKDW